MKKNSKHIKKEEHQQHITKRRRTSNKHTNMNIKQNIKKKKKIAHTYYNTILIIPHTPNKEDHKPHLTKYEEQQATLKTNDIKQT